MPIWVSTKRTCIVVIKDAAARDAETRRKINELCERLLRGVSNWQIAGETEEGMTGPVGETWV